MSSPVECELIIQVSMSMAGQIPTTRSRDLETSPGSRARLTAKLTSSQSEYRTPRSRLRAPLNHSISCRALECKVVISFENLRSSAGFEKEREGLW
jgi:hypothetical protein